jgi:hypothetical protein
VRAQLDVIVRAVDTATAYVEVGSDTLTSAVDVVCDHLGIVSDADRRIVRRGVTRRLELAKRLEGG